MPDACDLAAHTSRVCNTNAVLDVCDIAGETTSICPWRPVAAFEGRSDLYIYPGYRFKQVDAMITNFHLPQSTLLMLVSAFAKRETILAAYREAIEQGYRFFSYGDGMLIA